MYESGSTPYEWYTAYTPHHTTNFATRPGVAVNHQTSAARRALARDYLAQEKVKSDERARIISENTTFRCERCGI